MANLVAANGQIAPTEKMHGFNTAMASPTGFEPVLPP